MDYIEGVWWWSQRKELPCSHQHLISGSCPSWPSAMNNPDIRPTTWWSLKCWAFLCPSVPVPCTSSSPALLTCLLVDHSSELTIHPGIVLTFPPGLFLFVCLFSTFTHFSSLSFGSAVRSLHENPYLPLISVLLHHHFSSSASCPGSRMLLLNLIPTRNVVCWLTVLDLTTLCQNPVFGLREHRICCNICLLREGKSYHMLAYL